MLVYVIRNYETHSPIALLHWICSHQSFVSDLL